MRNNSFYSILDRGISALLKIVTVILIGHWLGATGQGIYALLLVIWAWTGTFSALGIGIANNYMGARAGTPEEQSVLFGNSLLLGLLTGLVSAALILALFTFTDIFRALPANQTTVLVVGVVLNAINVLLLGLLLGMQEFKLRAFSSVINFGVFLILLIWQFFTGKLTVNVIGQDWLISLVLMMMLWAWSMLKRSGFKIRINMVVLKEQMTRGWKSYLYSLSSTSLTRIDTVIVSYLLGVQATGIYSAAIYFAEILIYFPSALTTVLLAAVGSGKQVTKEIYRTISTFFILAILAFALLIPFGIKLMFPPEYTPAILLAEIMLVGVYFLGMGTIGAFHRFGTENLTLPFFAAFAGVIVEVVMDFLLVPYIGLIGAAIADILAYIVFGYIILNSIRKIYSGSIIELLLPLNPLKLVREFIVPYVQRRKKQAL